MSIAELKLDNPVSADLLDGCHSASFKDLPQTLDEDSRFRRCGSRKLRQVASESRIDDYLLLMLWLGELDQEDLGGEIVDIRDAESEQSCGQLVCNDL